VVGKCLDGSPSIQKFKEFVSSGVNEGGYLPYLFDPTFDLDTNLENDYYIPPIFSSNDLVPLIPSKIRPDFKWLLIGNDTTGSVMHVDPYGSSAWNALISGGHKDWLIISTPKSINLGKEKLLSNSFEWALKDFSVANGLEEIQNILG